MIAIIVMKSLRVSKRRSRVEIKGQWKLKNSAPFDHLFKNNWKKNAKNKYKLAIERPSKKRKIKKINLKEFP